MAWGEPWPPSNPERNHGSAILCAFDLLEIDGQIREFVAPKLSIRFKENAASVVSFRDQHPFLTQLRNRGIISDSPRIIADDERDGRTVS